MTTRRWSHPTHAAQGRSGAEQGGFALMAVLAAIALTFLVVGVLFGLMTATQRITAAEERAAREGRAADGAVETAIQLLRGGDCDRSAQPLIDDLTFDQGTTAAGDDVDVDVRCEPVVGSASAEDRVRIIGRDGYQGPLAWASDCSGAPPTPEGCLPWTAAVGSVPAGLASSGVSLVHSGPQPLRFESGVTVFGGAAALRNPTTDSPAIDVGGEYTQGAPGLLGAGATDCGLLAGDPGSGAGLIRDAGDDPECGANLDAIDGDPTGNVAGLVAPATTPALPTCAGGVVSFLPGTYDTAATNAVSAMTDGSNPACRNTTFHFTPGIYSFQGELLHFGDAGSSYVFGTPAGWSPPAGVPAGVGPDDPLCDANAPGTSIVIAGWTEIRHEAGRVALCAARPIDASNPSNILEPHPGLFQQAATPTGVEVVGFDRNPVQNGLDLPFRCRAGLNYPRNSDFVSVGGPCRPVRTYDLRLATGGQAPVNSLRVMLTGSENTNTPNNLITRRQTRITLFGSSGGPICSTGWVRGTPNGDLTSSFDLKELGTCRTTDINQSTLDGGRLRVSHRMDLGFPTVVQSLDIADVSVEVNAAIGEAAVAQSADFAAAANVLSAGAPSATPNMPCGDFVCPVDDPGRSITPDDPFIHEMELSDFDFPQLSSSTNPGLDPQVNELRAVVRVAPQNASLPAGWPPLFDVQNFLVPTRTFLELRLADGTGRCIVQGSGMNSDQEIAFDLLDPNLEDTGPSGCNTVLVENASQLDDVTLSLRFELPCVPDYAAGIPGRCFRALLENPSQSPAQPVWQMRPPDIEHVRLTALTDTYTGPPIGSRVTVDAATNAGFHVAGKAWLPTSDLDLHWNGTASALPLFEGDLVLHGLASTMAPGAVTGVVCCGPAESRTLELTATIEDTSTPAHDGPQRLGAVVEIIDVEEVGGVTVPSRGHAVDVLAWSTCGAIGCAAVLDEIVDRSG